MWRKWIVFLAAILALAIAFPENKPDCGALCDYVHHDDGYFEYRQIQEYQEPGVDTYVLNMTSQRWFDESWSDRPIWWHYVIVHVPHERREEFHDRAFLYVSTGNNNDGIPNIGTRHVNETKLYAINTGMITAVIRQIPAQPITFHDQNSSKVEDGIIAYTWRVFLENEEAPPDILLRFPMCKAVTRAMDAITLFVQEDLGIDNIKHYMITGESKRGWTTWLMGVADNRVEAIAPVILTCVNTQENMKHYYSSLGGWPWMFIDYWLEGIMLWIDHPRTDEMETYIDPYHYRENLTLPKLIISATNDEFFMNDDYWYFFDGMPEPKYIWKLENSGHSIHHGPVYWPYYWDMLETFYMAVILEHEFPKFSWERTDHGNITRTGDITLYVEEGDVIEVDAWWSITPEMVAPRRDYRALVDVPPVPSGANFTLTEVEELDDDVYYITMDYPDDPDAFMAFYMRVRFEGPEDRVLTFTSEVNIIPDIMPFRSCSGVNCMGPLV